MRRIGSCSRRSVGRRAHPRFVGEETALDTVDHRLGDGITERTRACLLNPEGGLDDQHEHMGQLGDVHRHDHQRQQDVGQRHKGHYQLGKTGDATNAAEDNQAGERHQRQTADPVRNAKRHLHRQTDGVGLHRVEHQAKCQDQAEREDHPHPAHAKAFLHVVGRATTVVAILILDLVELGQSAFNEGGRHADKGNQPHPEDGAGATQIDGDSHTGQVAGADTGGKAGTEGLEGGDACVVRFTAVFQHGKHVAKVTDLDKTQAEGEKDTDPDEQVDEHGSPHQVV